MNKIDEKLGLRITERSEIIGLAIDANLDLYRSFLNGNGFNFEGSEDDKRVGAAILAMAHWGYVDDFFEKFYDGGNEVKKMFRWGRSILFLNGAEDNFAYTLRTYQNVKTAKKVFNAKRS